MCTTAIVSRSGSFFGSSLSIRSIANGLPMSIEVSRRPGSYSSVYRTPSPYASRR